MTPEFLWTLLCNCMIAHITACTLSLTYIYIHTHTHISTCKSVLEFQQKLFKKWMLVREHKKYYTQSFLIFIDFCNLISSLLVFVNDTRNYYLEYNYSYTGLSKGPWMVRFYPNGSWYLFMSNKLKTITFNTTLHTYLHTDFTNHCSHIFLVYTIFWIWFFWFCHRLNSWVTASLFTQPISWFFFLPCSSITLHCIIFHGHVIFKLFLKSCMWKTNQQMKF